MIVRWVGVVTFVILSFAAVRTAAAQSYGVELHNNMMPASGAMGGASFTRPQDVQSAINGNPATLRQFSGPIFGFGGAFVEPTYNVTQTSNLPLVGVTPFDGKSSAPPSLLGNIGVIHQTEVMDLPVTFGLGFITNAGLAVDFRHIDESGGTQASYVALDTISSAAIDLTDVWTFGTSIAIGTHFIDGPFVQSSSSQSDYATRFTLGTNYELGRGMSVGAFWQSEKDLTFDNMVRFASGPFAGITQDMNVEHPQNVGVGFAHRCLMDGKLLVAVDALYKNWEGAEFFRALYEDQWAFQFGTQYTYSPRIKLRMGYAFSEDPTRDTVPGSIGGVSVGDVPAIQYVQGQFAIIARHRLTGGIGDS